MTQHNEYDECNSEKKFYIKIDASGEKSPGSIYLPGGNEKNIIDIIIDIII
jgi:hypothetical protein